MSFLFRLFTFAAILIQFDESATETFTIQAWHLRDISVGMQAKHFWSVGGGQIVNVLVVVGNLGTFGNDVALVEDKILQEHGFTKPHFAEAVQQTFVKIVCHTAAILDFTEHVAHTSPVYSLHAL